MNDKYTHSSDLSTLVAEWCASPLSFVHLNMQSARRKMDDFSELLRTFSFQFSVIMMTETWFFDDTDVISIDGYKGSFLNREFKRGGGVSIHLKLDTKYEYVEDFSCSCVDFEVLCLQCDAYIFVVAYIPPDGDVQNFFQFLDGLFSFVDECKYTLVFGGDFNIDMFAKGRDQNKPNF